MNEVRMVTPYHAISPLSRRRLFWVLLIVTLFLMVAMNTAGAGLVNESAPYGIISFELAGSVEKAGAILTSWDRTAEISAAFNLGLDYLFMLAYAASIGLGCTLAGEAMARRGWPLAGLGAWLAWGLILAAICDGLENWALMGVLNSLPGPGMLWYGWPSLARSSALIKFGLVFAGVIYLFYGGAVLLVQRLGVRK
jgi:hypothetical protein